MKHFLGILALAAISTTGFAQSVTVGTTGAQYESINEAIAAVFTDPAAPDIITIVDEGPFFEMSSIIIDDLNTSSDDMIIQGAPGIRPIVVVDVEASASDRKMGFYLRKLGNLTIRDIILLPPVAGVTPENYETKVPDTGITIYVDNTQNTSITLENMLISSNNGNNQPTAALDGLTPPVTTPETVHFIDEAITHQSSASTAQEHYLYTKDLVISGVYGPGGSDAIRGFPDGGVGSRWILGPGTVLSYNGGHGFQPGGAENFTVEIRGEEDNPVKIINNEMSGIHVTNTAGAAEGLTHIEWCIIANNGLHGINNGDTDTGTQLTNVTIANNTGNVFLNPSTPSAITYNFSNVIAAGDGATADPDNVIRINGSGSFFPSYFNPTDSALVLNGDYTMNNTLYGGDGIDSSIQYTVTPVNIINSDPEFVSLNPAGPGFAVVTNQAYGTAGPGGQPLVGGGSLAPASVEDWQLF